MPDEFPTLKAVAEYLKAGERVVYRLVHKGHMPGFKVGGVWRFHRARLNQWIEEQTMAVARDADGPTPLSQND